MGPRTVIAGSIDISAVILIANASTGAPSLGLAAADLTISYWRNRNTVSSISLSDLGGVNSAHSNGGVAEIGNGLYRVDIPDAAFAFGTAFVQITGSATGHVIYGPHVELIDPAQALFQSEAIGSVNNSSTTLHMPNWTFANNEINNDIIGILDVSTNEWHYRTVDDWNGTTKLVGVAALPFTPQSGVDLVIRLGQLDLTAIRAEIDAGVSSLATSSALSAVNTLINAIKAVTDRQDKAIIVGSITGSPTTLSMQTSVTGLGDDALIGRVLTFDEDAAGSPGYQSYITDYVSSSGTITWENASPGTPQVGDFFTVS